MTPRETQAPPRPLAEVARYFFRLGVIAFGGPAAHIALMRRELVVERKWVTDAEFVDLMGVTNLIPGPNSTEMTMHLGARRAGWRGLWLGGAAFILPAVAIVLALAWAYARWGATPGGAAILFGIQPVILAVIVQAIWGLRRAAVKGTATFIVVVVVAALALAGAGELWLLLGAGVSLLFLWFVTGGRASGGWSALKRAGDNTRRAAVVAWPLTVPLPGLAVTVAARPETAGAGLLPLFLVFLKIGATLYGSGYVLVSFLQAEFVASRGWITQTELLDAVSVGQFTPGPLFSSATFVGYLVRGLPGALVATAGIFLPSFLFVAGTHRFVPRLRELRWTAPVLDGVNAAAIALMAVVTYELAREMLGSVFQVSVLALAALVLLRLNPNSALLIAGGAAAGVAHALIT